MEIMDNNNKCGGYNDRSVGRNIFLGVVLVGIGVIWLLNNMDIISECVFDVILSWQVLLIVIGGYLISLRNWIAGGIVAAVGGAFLILQLTGIHVSFHKVILPVLLITAGAGIILSKVLNRN